MKSNLKTVVIEYNGALKEAEVVSEYMESGSSYLALRIEGEDQLLHGPLSTVKEVKSTNDDLEEQSFMQKMGMFQEMVQNLGEIEKAISEVQEITDEEPVQEKEMKLEPSIEVKQLDWKKAEAHLMATKKKYEEARQGQFGLEKKIMPLVKRLENEERSPELYEAIMKL